MTVPDFIKSIPYETHSSIRQLEYLYAFWLLHDAYLKAEVPPRSIISHLEHGFRNMTWYKGYQKDFSFIIFPEFQTNAERMIQLYITKAIQNSKNRIRDLDIQFIQELKAPANTKKPWNDKPAIQNEGKKLMLEFRVSGVIGDPIVEEQLEDSESTKGEKDKGSTRSGKDDLVKATPQMTENRDLRGDGKNLHQRTPCKIDGAIFCLQKQCSTCSTFPSECLKSQEESHQFLQDENRGLKARREKLRVAIKRSADNIRIQEGKDLQEKQRPDVNEEQHTGSDPTMTTSSSEDSETENKESPTEIAYKAREARCRRANTFAQTSTYKRTTWTGMMADQQKRDIKDTFSN
ncbi:unnamed protein product [Sphagnum tenellum]